MLQKLKDKIFKRKLAKLGFDMKDEENDRLASVFQKRGLGGNHFVKCMEVGIKTHNLQKVCEALSGRKEAGRYLQIKPLVIQCHSCQEDFSDKEGVEFAGKVKCIGDLDKIVQHLLTCDGIICDCGKKVLYFDTCKKCKRKWDKRAYYLKRINQKCVNKKQKEQIKKYNKFICSSECNVK